MDAKNMSLDDLIKRDRQHKRGGRGGFRGGNPGGMRRGGSGAPRFSDRQRGGG